MTLTKYWVRQGYWVDDEFLEPGNPAHRECFYLTSDVDKVVEEMRERIKGLEKRIASQRSNISCKEELHKETKDKLQADLARVTAANEGWHKRVKELLADKEALQAKLDILHGDEGHDY